MSGKLNDVITELENIGRDAIKVGEDNNKICDRIMVLANKDTNTMKFDDVGEISLDEVFEKISVRLGVEIKIINLDQIPKDKGVIMLPCFRDPVIRYKIEGLELPEIVYDKGKDKESEFPGAFVGDPLSNNIRGLTHTPFVWEYDVDFDYSGLYSIKNEKIDMEDI